MEYCTCCEVSQKMQMIYVFWTHSLWSMTAFTIPTSNIEIRCKALMSYLQKIWKERKSKLWQIVEALQELWILILVLEGWDSPQKLGNRNRVKLAWVMREYLVMRLRFFMFTADNAAILNCIFVINRLDEVMTFLGR